MSTFQGSVVTINGVEAESGVTAFDFSKPVVLSVITAKSVKDYTVYVGAYTGLPTVWLETTNHSDVVTASTIYSGKIKVVGNTLTSMNGILTESSVKFKAVGSLSWYQSRIHTSLQLGKNEFDLLFSSEMNSTFSLAVICRYWTLLWGKRGVFIPIKGTVLCFITGQHSI